MNTSASEEQERTAAPLRMGVLRQLWTVIGTSILLATLFTAWTSERLFSENLIETIAQSLAPQRGPEAAGVLPTSTPRPRPQIGVVAGHWGGNDPGAVCTDGLTEMQVNLNVATLVKQKLVENGFDVDLLEEFDPRLSGYQAMALVSIHADSCDYINDLATGFKVAAALGSTDSNQAARLTACLRSRYAQVTQMPYHGTSITADMTSYHAFDEIHVNTPASIIETGFLNLDRQILTQQPDLIAEGITQGILCYIYNQDISAPAVP